MIVKKVIQKTDCYKGVFSIEPHPPFFKSFGNSSPIPTILIFFFGILSCLYNSNNSTFLRGFTQMPFFSIWETKHFIFFLHHIHLPASLWLWISFVTLSLHISNYHYPHSFIDQGGYKRPNFLPKIKMDQSLKSGSKQLLCSKNLNFAK